jgi:hypothetical protein
MNERSSELPPAEAPERFREQPRYAPTVQRAYTNDRIEVTWEPAFCIGQQAVLRRQSSQGRFPDRMSDLAETWY